MFLPNARRIQAPSPSVGDVLPGRGCPTGARPTVTVHPDGNTVVPVVPDV